MDEHIEGCDEERIGKREAVGREYPLVRNLRERTRSVNIGKGMMDDALRSKSTTA